MDLDRPVTLRELQQSLSAINSFIKKAEDQVKQREEHQAHMLEAWNAGEWKKWLLLSVHFHKGIATNNTIHHLKSE